MCAQNRNPYSMLGISRATYGRDTELCHLIETVGNP